MGLLYIQLELSCKVCGDQPVLHISLLHRYLLGSDRMEPSALIIMEDEYKYEYELEALISHG